METVRIVAELEIKPEFKNELMPVFKTLVEGSRAEPGNRGYDMIEDLENSAHFFVIETWASKAAIEEHNASPHFQAFAKAIDGKALKLSITQAKTLY